MKQKKPQEPKVYLVNMVRKDYDYPLVLLETKDEKEAIEKLNNVEKEWIASGKEERPFRLSTPHKEAFISYLILSVHIEEMSEEEYQQLKDPLHQQMQQQGTSQVMNNMFKGV